MTVIMRCDGSSRPTNPGPSGAGVAFFDLDDNFIIGASKSLGWLTNNESEYQALILGFEAAIAWSFPDLLVQADSKLVIEQMKGNWGCNKPHLEILRDRGLELATWFDSVQYEWIPRALNGEADELAMQASLAEGELWEMGERL